MANSVRTTCPYCGVGCGVIATKEANDRVTIEGDPDHPANFGKLCSKGLALGETLGLEGRLLQPKIKGMTTSWDMALDFVANGLAKTIERHGPDSIAFYVSGQLLSEDYYVANKLIKGFLGTANIDTNSRLCMSSSVAGHKRAFGSDTVPQTYEDFEKANLVVLVGSNLAWCHPVLYQRLKKARKQNGTKVVVIDPRKTATCEIADLHLAIAPGRDVLLFNGLLNYLHNNNAIHSDFVNAHVENAELAIQAVAAASNITEIAKSCELCVQDVALFYKWFLETPKTLSVYSQGVNQSSSGTDKVNAILNCHLYTGRIGKEGCGPLSVTGQPNAMGGREVGGLANMLAAHMDFNPDDLDKVRTFWNAPNLATQPGKKAVDMFEAVHSGEIKAIWIMATNPAVSLPNASRARQALEKCPLVIVSDCVDKNDTLAYADICLPAATWGERNGSVTNTERCISRQRPFETLPDMVLPDWQIITKVAQAMGFKKAFPYESSFDVFKEHVALSSFQNDGSRDFDLSGWMGMDQTQFDQLEPTTWPVSENARKRFFADGRFYTPSGKANMLALDFRMPAHVTNKKYPHVLNTGRIRDQWHTMTRTGLSARLSNHFSEPYLEIHPETAERKGVEQGDLVQVTSKWGSAILRARLNDGLQKSHVFMPMHWNDTNSAKAVVGTLVNPVTDPVSGQPESKHTPVKFEKYKTKWFGLLISHKPIETPNFCYWTCTRGNGCYIYDIAGNENTDDWNKIITNLIGEGETLSMEDPKRQHYRYGLLHNNRAVSALYISQKREDIPSRDWIVSLFEKPTVTPDERFAMLNAKPAGQQLDKGVIICSCFNVGLLEIQRAISEQNLVSIEEIGASLKAGTNCGSCQSEIKSLLDTAIKNSQKNDKVA